MLSPKDRAKLLSKMMAAALHPEDWQKLLDSISEVLDGAKLHLIGYDIRHREHIGGMTSGHDPEWMIKYVNHYARLNPYPPISGRLRVGAYFDLSSLIPEEEIRKNEFFNDFMRPQENLSGGSGLLLGKNGNTMFVLGTLHPNSHRKRLDVSAVELWKTLSSDLVTAWQLSKTVGSASYERSDEVIRNSLQPIIITLDNTGRPISLNAAAERALANGIWVFEDKIGRIRLVDREADQIAILITRTLNSRDMAAPRTLRLKTNGSSALCYLSPLDPDALKDSSSALILGIPRCAVVVAIFPIIPLTNSNLPKQLFGLTCAEIAVAEAIAAGASTEEIAASREVSIHTVRTQIKSAMTKCQVYRRSQLAVLVTSGWQRPANVAPK